MSQRKGHWNHQASGGKILLLLNNQSTRSERSDVIGRVSQEGR